jgi:hypothetical protein
MELRLPGLLTVFGVNIPISTLVVSGLPWSCQGSCACSEALARSVVPANDAFLEPRGEPGEMHVACRSVHLFR